MRRGDEVGREREECRGALTDVFPRRCTKAALQRRGAQPPARVRVHQARTLCTRPLQLMIMSPDQDKVLGLWAFGKGGGGGLHRASSIEDRQPRPTRP